MSELPITFSCAGETLLGVVHHPATSPGVGIVIVVGGPQYRVGSHRQFVLLARSLAARGVAVLRFDCRGMGDSTGEFPGFEHIQPDVGAAIDAMLAAAPTVRCVGLWGLCDATLVICAQARRDHRIAGVALLNPWIRSESGQARAQLKHYYFARLADKVFLRKLIRGEVDLLGSLRSFAGVVGRALRSFHLRSDARAKARADAPLAAQLADDLRRFQGRVLIVLAGRDLTAMEFEDFAGRSEEWRRIYAAERVEKRNLPEADHTFSRREWRDRVADWTVEWIEAWASPR